MTARKRTDAEPPPEIPETAPKYDYGGLGTMIAREVAIEARKDRARREFYRIEHESLGPTMDDGRRTMDGPKSKIPAFLGLYRVTGSNNRIYDVLIRDPDPEHHVN